MRKVLVALGWEESMRKVLAAPSWEERMRKVLVALGCVALLAGCGDGNPASTDGGSAIDSSGSSCDPQTVVPVGTDFFRDISEVSGIREENFDPNPPSPIPINDHSRLGFADINGDGLDDIVMHSLFPNVDQGIPMEHLVFLNNGDGTFRNFSDESGLREIQAGFLAFGDVDNDGDLDCFAGLDIPLAGHTHTFLLNDGAGHFTVTADSGLEGRAGYTRAGNAVFADFNRDGKLDIYIGNGHTSYAAQDQLFLGNGDGTFNDATANLVGNEARPSNGTVACDYDNDGDLDIFVSTYGVSVLNGHNVLWENDGTGAFTNVAVERGFAALATGNYYLATTDYGTTPEPDQTPATYVGSNGFGLQCEDINNDGLMDIYLTTISHPVESDYSRKWSDPSQVLINQGAEQSYAFVNEFLTRMIPFNEGDVDGDIVDFDNDGRLDLSTSRERKYESNYEEWDQRGWFGLFQQQTDGTFTSYGRTSGINYPEGAFLQMRGAQNHAWSDIDLDGDLDLLVGGRGTSTGRPNFLFENLIGSQNRWLGVRLKGDGTRVNREAIGGRVTVKFASTQLMRELKSSRGMHNSMDMRALHFGLGDLGCDFDLIVRWPDGTRDTFTADQIQANSYVTIDYAQGIVP